MPSTNLITLFLDDIPHFLKYHNTHPIYSFPPYNYYPILLQSNNAVTENSEYAWSSPREELSIRNRTHHYHSAELEAHLNPSPVWQSPEINQQWDEIPLIRHLEGQENLQN